MYTHMYIILADLPQARSDFCLGPKMAGHVILPAVPLEEVFAVSKESIDGASNSKFLIER